MNELGSVQIRLIWIKLVTNEKLAIESLTNSDRSTSYELFFARPTINPTTTQAWSIKTIKQ